ncbi:hypothetical protein S245_052502 [Arachis hypogaea]
MSKEWICSYYSTLWSLLSAEKCASKPSHSQSRSELVMFIKFLAFHVRAELQEFKHLDIPILGQIIQEAGVDDRWSRAYLLYTLGAFLCPTNRNKPSTEFLGALLHVRRCRSYNWSFLIHG